MSTTDNLAQSLVNDGWTILNRWQDAADNGYGYLPTLGAKTDAAIELADDAFFTLGQYAAKGWAWWQNGGKDQVADLGWAIARGVALLVMLLACLACVVGFAAASAWRWARRHGVPGADATCRFLLCYEEEVPGVRQREAAEPSQAEELIAWAVARWPQLAAN